MRPCTSSPLRLFWLAFLVALLLVSTTAWSSSRAQGEPERIVDLVEVRGVIDPSMAGYLENRLANAQRDRAHAVIVELDTPGGLDVSMRKIISGIRASEVPVIVWVAPPGARAASAGTFITYAAHLAYMAEATEIGAATPINLAGDTPATLERKITNDAAAFIRELAITTGRNPDWAERAVREAESIGATEAEEIGVVNGIESSLRDLLRVLDGQSVEIHSGRVVLETWDESSGAPSATIRFQGMNIIERLLHAVTTPEMAFLLLLIGAFGLIFEIYNPGIGLAGVLGVVALLLSLYALSILPTNWAGVLLIVAALVFLLVDLQTAGLGVFTVGGMAALVLGGSLLFAGAAPGLELSVWAIVAAVAVTSLFFISVMTAALRVRLRRPITGEEAMVGTLGEATTDIAPEGTVQSKGTLWRARTMETGIAQGSKVKVMAIEGLVLLVEPLAEDAEADPEPERPVSSKP